MKLSGNTILITGGGSGIGRELARRFHALGNKVIVAGRRPEQLEETIGGRDGMFACLLDVADPAVNRGDGAGSGCRPPRPQHPHQQCRDHGDRASG